MDWLKIVGPKGYAKRKRKFDRLRKQYFAPKKAKVVTMWIPVADKLPDTFERVLVFVPKKFQGEVDIAHHVDGEWKVDGDVTHWAPLPQPPTT